MANSPISNSCKNLEVVLVDPLHVLKPVLVRTTMAAATRSLGNEVLQVLLLRGARVTMIRTARVAVAAAAAAAAALLLGVIVIVVTIIMVVSTTEAKVKTTTAVPLLLARHLGTKPRPDRHSTPAIPVIQVTARLPVWARLPVSLLPVALSVLRLDYLLETSML